MRITFDVNLNISSDTQKQILDLVKYINSKLDKIMGELEDINAQLDRIDTAHVAIKKDLDFIKAKLEAAGTGSLPAADVQALKTRVTAIADKFASLDEETDSSETPAEG